jgi:hypothetical protein
MADLGVALTWLAISAASVKGLSAFARAAITDNAEAESALLAGEGSLGHEALYPLAPSAAPQAARR